MYKAGWAMKNNRYPNKAWALVVAMSVLAATAVAQQPGQLPEQVAVCAALQMVSAADVLTP